MVGGKEYISSKRASQLTHYSQDYIGHLARSGQISAQRIGGLWYILLDSLKLHQDGGSPSIDAQGYQSTAMPSTDPDSFVGLDGKKYVSAGKAARSSGYNQDYVGQLARSGQILARQVGNRWYVDEGSVLEHKRQKDALLAAVQAESVGLQITEPVFSQSRPESLDTMRYFSDTSDLMPRVALEADEKTGSGSPIADPDVVDIGNMEDDLSDISSVSAKINIIPIRVGRGDSRPSMGKTDLEALRSRYLPSVTADLQRSSGGAWKSSVFTALAGSALTIVIVVSLGFSSVRSQAIYSLIGGDRDALNASVAIFSPAVDRIERLLTKELVYTRTD